MAALKLVLIICAASMVGAAAPMTAIAEPSAVSAQTAAVEPDVVSDDASGDIFPAAWLTPHVDARAEPVDERIKPRTLALVARALAKYPPAVLGPNLRKVYVLGRLQYFGISTGGTNSRTDVYLADSGRAPTPAVEEVFHAEFSSILLRNFPQYLDEAKWRAANAPGFAYRGSGVQSIREGQAGQGFSEALHEQGFIHQYATSDLEDDFNSFAGRLFMGDANLWRIMGRYPKIKAKAMLTMDFYGRLDTRFTQAFFQSLRQDSRPPVATPTGLN